MKSVFGLLQKSHQNMLELDKMDRPDQLIFQIGIRQHYLANQSFTDYDDIVSKVCKAWNRFLDSTDRVTKMCTREWINLIS